MTLFYRKGEYERISRTTISQKTRKYTRYEWEDSRKTRGSIFLSTQSTLLNSPYNTYRKYGLPPGPINNPGADALRAAVNPTPGDWLYFITVAPFDTRFTSDINQFNDWKVEYKKNLRAGKFRSEKK